MFSARPRYTAVVYAALALTLGSLTALGASAAQTDGAVAAAIGRADYATAGALLRTGLAANPADEAARFTLRRCDGAP